MSILCYNFTKINEKGFLMSSILKEFEGIEYSKKVRDFNINFNSNIKIYDDGSSLTGSVANRDSNISNVLKQALDSVGNIMERY